MSSYFSLDKMGECTARAESSNVVEISGDPNRKYIISIDPSWSESEIGDDFAMAVFKLDEENKKSSLVHAYGIAGNSLKQNIEYFHYLITSFNACAVCLSYASGIQFISACNENELFLKSGITLGTVDVECDNINKDSYNNDLFEIKSNLNPSEHKYCFLRKPTSQWIRYANELLQANIDHKKIEFASASLGHPLSYVANKIELTKIQASKIEVTSNPQGSLTFNLPLEFQHSKDKDRFRKDNYQALLLGNWMVKVYFDSLCAKPNDSKKKFTKSIAPTKSCKGFLPLSSGKIIPMDKINYIGPLESIKGSGYCGVYCYMTVSNMVFHLTEEDHKEIVEKIRSSK